MLLPLGKQAKGDQGYAVTKGGSESPVDPWTVVRKRLHLSEVVN